MNKKKIIIHIITPIIIAIITNLICMKLFYVPNPSKPNTAVGATYAISVGVSVFILGISSIVSAILYFGRKKNNN